MSVSPRISAQSAPESSASASIALHKRTISKLSVESAENKPNSIKNVPNPCALRPKRVRKASQNAQFLTDQDEISSLDSYSSDGYEKSSPVVSGAQTEPTRHKVVVEIPFRSEIHHKRGPLYLLESLHPNPTNRGPKAKPIPKKWTKKQPNDHTSKQKQPFLTVFNCFFFLFYIIYTNFY